MSTIYLIIIKNTESISNPFNALANEASLVPINKSIYSKKILNQNTQTQNLFYKYKK